MYKCHASNKMDQLGEETEQERKTLHNLISNSRSITKAKTQHLKMRYSSLWKSTVT